MDTNTNARGWMLTVCFMVLSAGACSGPEPKNTQAGRETPKPSKVKTRLLWQKHGHLTDVTSIAFSPDGKTIVSGADAGDETIRFWNSADGEIIRTINTVHSWCVDYVPQGDAVAGGSHGTIQLWSVPDGTMLRTINYVSSSIRELRFAPDGNTLACGGLDETVCLWDRASGKKTKELSISGFCWAMAFSPDGRFLAVGGDPDITLFSLDTGETRHVLKTYPPEKRYDANIDTFAVVFTPDGASLISGGADKVLRIWDLASGTVTASYETGQAAIKSLAIRPDGKKIAIGTFMDLGLLDCDSGMITPFQERCKPINALDFSADGSLLATGSNDQTVSVWRVAN